MGSSAQTPDRLAHLENVCQVLVLDSLLFLPATRPQALGEAWLYLVDSRGYRALSIGDHRTEEEDMRPESWAPLRLISFYFPVLVFLV